MEFLLQRRKRSIFHNIFKPVVFQRHKKALIWNNGFRDMMVLIILVRYMSLHRCLGLASNKEAQCMGIIRLNLAVQSFG